MMLYILNPTISTGAYQTGDVIGNSQTLSNASSKSGYIHSIMIFDADGEKDQIDFFFFRGALTGTYTDNAAFSLDAADAPNLCAVASVAAADYFDAGADAIAVKTNLSIPFKSGENNISVVSVVRGTPTYTATTDLRFEIGVRYGVYD